MQIIYSLDELPLKVKKSEIFSCGDKLIKIEKSISLNGIVATFNSTNIYKIIENRCSSKKMLLWTILQSEIFHS